MTTDKLLYVNSVAEALACSRSWVYELLKNRELLGVRKGSYIRIYESSLRDFLERNKLDPDDYFK